MTLFDEPRRGACEIVALKPRELEWIGWIIDRRAHERIHAFAHETGIRSEHERDRPRGIRPRDELVDLECFERDHR